MTAHSISDEGIAVRQALGASEQGGLKILLARAAILSHQFVSFHIELVYRREG